MKDVILSIYKKIHSEFDFVDENLGLYSGVTGVLLFLYEYNKVYVTEDSWSHFEDGMNKLFERIHTSQGFNFSNGLCGIGWFLDYLLMDGIETEEINLLLDRIDFLALKYIDKSDFDFDFMHGDLGIIYYLTQRDKIDDNVVLYLIKVLGHHVYNGYWFVREEKHINLSMAHGSAAVIAVLAKLLESCSISSKNARILKRLMDKMIGFIEERKSQGHSIYYPSACSFEANSLRNEYSRLSWCYGDLGIGLSLSYAGKVLGNNKYLQLASDCYANLSKRIPSQELDVVDSCMCHGYAGILKLYDTFSKLTKADMSKEKGNWLRQTIISQNDNKNIIYRYWNNSSKKWQESFNMINGLAGTGLVLLDQVNLERRSWAN